MKKKTFTLDGLYSFFHLVPVNAISKWTSLCIAMDFENDKVVLFFNGKNRYEKIRRLGHYFFDNKPIIGKLINVNIWGRSVKKI